MRDESIKGDHDIICGHSDPLLVTWPFSCEEEDQIYVQWPRKLGFALKLSFIFFSFSLFLFLFHFHFLDRYAIILMYDINFMIIVLYH